MLDRRSKRAPLPVHADRRAATTDRRTRRRFRELCDEVIAAVRVASDRDLWTERERAEAHAQLARIAPLRRA